MYQRWREHQNGTKIWRAREEFYDERCYAKEISLNMLRRSRRIEAYLRRVLGNDGGNSDKYAALCATGVCER